MPPRKPVAADLSVGALASRAGVPVSTLHYYESIGLIAAWRTAANHRRYDRTTLRRVAIIKAAQRLGVPLAEIGQALDALPKGRTATAADWAAMSRVWAGELTDRIERLTKLRDQLDHCIGCGCLSVSDCPLHNPGDQLGDEGSGPRRLDPD
ncbi:redox-sensitive transcriptional activator SoxR [Oceanibium sediminis]|uniref:redox-sensitive transcriptional activator SoxR n=1 Tax=Oceanibium sediminis TaxID=2026339 RepID=UPI000DD4D335|nr:redox-sensitive transcriptional activator SoxR [Oceanibium sediminis]